MNEYIWAILALGALGTITATAWAIVAFTLIVWRIVKAMLRRP